MVDPSEATDPQTGAEVPGNPEGAGDTPEDQSPGPSTAPEEASAEVATTELPSPGGEEPASMETVSQGPESPQGETEPSSGSDPSNTTPPDSAPTESSQPESSPSDSKPTGTDGPEAVAKTRKGKGASPTPTDRSATVPTVAATLEAPPLGAGAAAGEGGEWELLLSKLGSWWGSGTLAQQLASLRQPLTLLAALVGLLLVLRIYRSVLGAVDSLPLVPGLLELVGLIWLLRIGVPRLLRRSEREQLLSGLQKRRQDFLG